MTAETTKTSPTEVVYDSMTHTVTIRFKDGIAVTLPLNDALKLGHELANLIRPIWQISYEATA